LTLELPGGTVEKNESPEEAIKRECFEETGILMKNLQPLVEYYPGLDNVDNKTNIYYSEEIEKTRKFQAEIGEVVEILWVPLQNCLKRIYQGQLIDALTIIGVLAYQGLSRSS